MSVPFNLRFMSDSYEFTPEVTIAGNFDKGFELVYIQTAC